jgi:hypothetical protein
MEGFDELAMQSDCMGIEEWSRCLQEVECAIRKKHRPARVAGLIFGSALGAALVAATVFLSL